MILSGWGVDCRVEPREIVDIQEAISARSVPDRPWQWSSLWRSASIRVPSW